MVNALKLPDRFDEIVKQVNSYSNLQLDNKALDTFTTVKLLQEIERTLEYLEVIYATAQAEFQNMQLYPNPTIKNPIRTKNELLQTMNFVQKTKVELLNVLAKLKTVKVEDIPDMSININFQRPDSYIPVVELDDEQ